METKGKQTLFEFFTLSFEHSKELTTGGRIALNEASEYLNKLFARKDLPFKAGEKNLILPNHIYEVDDHVYLIRLHNQQIITYIKEEMHGEGERTYQPDTVKSYPYLYIVADNRAGSSKFAIMKSPVFGSSLDKVCRMLSKIFSDWMAPVGVTVEMNTSRIPMKFWTYVKKCMDEGHRLMSMNIHLYNFDQRSMNAPSNLTRNVKGMLNMMRITRALRSEFKLLAGPVGEEQMMLSKNMKDIAQIVGLCSTNDFALEVKFRGLPIYKYSGDENVKAIFPMPASAITEMVESEENPDLVIQWAEGTKRGLVLWLDKVHKQIFDYQTAAAKQALKVK